MPLGPPDDPERFDDFEECVGALMDDDMTREEAEAVCGSWESSQQSIMEKDDHLTKRVEFKATDDERQIATGVVLVPNKVDLQGDYVRESTIRDFAEGFMADLSNGDADGGVMHAVWPEDHVTLVENRVLDANTTVGGESYPKGTWTQAWKFADSDLWQLVSDGVLSGYSIGAKGVEWSDPMDQSELPDGVTVAADYPDDEPAFEIRDGKIAEVSAVDIPAVPDAQILAHKDASEKRVADLLGDKERFTSEMAERGHSDDDAERLWSYLQRATDAEADDDAKEGFFARVGQAAVKAIAGSDDGAHADDAPEASDGDAAAEKASRTLSQANVKRLKAAHDAVEDALATELNIRTNRFTDDPGDSFDIADYGKAAPTGEATAAAESDTTESNMADNDEDMPAWANELKEQTEANAERLEELAGGGDGDEEKAADNDGGDETPMADAPAWAKELKEQTEANAERVEELAKAAGHSQQLNGGSSESVDRKYSADWDSTLGLPTEGGN